MPTIQIELPSLLAAVAEGTRRLNLEAATLAGAFSAIAGKHPRLGLHLFDESGGLRQHVLCFHNGTNTRWLDDLNVPVREGDTLMFMQAVSGG